MESTDDNKNWGADATPQRASSQSFLIFIVFFVVGSEGEVNKPRLQEKCTKNNVSASTFANL